MYDVKPWESDERDALDAALAEDNYGDAGDQGAEAAEEEPAPEPAEQPGN